MKFISLGLGSVLALAAGASADITLLSRHSEATSVYHQPYPIPPNDVPYTDFAEFNSPGDWSVVLEHGAEHSDFARTDAIGGYFYGRLQGGNPSTLYPYLAWGASQNVTFFNPRHRHISIRLSGECTPCWEQRTESPNLTFKLVNADTNDEAFNIFGDSTFTTYGWTQRIWQDQTWNIELPRGTYELTTFGGFEETDYMAGTLFARGILDFTLTFGDETCPADFNSDWFVDFFDYTAFVECFEGGACPPGLTADFNEDDFVDFFDYLDFVGAFEDGC